MPLGVTEVLKGCVMINEAASVPDIDKAPTDKGASPEFSIINVFSEPVVPEI